MKIFRKILFPFAVLYGWIVDFLNFLYNKGVKKSYSFDIPIIVVGNLSMGGTGKTPQIEYLISLLSAKYNIAVLSRGYKRKSKGFILADKEISVELIGDEPFQYFTKFKNIRVAVDSNRKNGIEQLLKLDNPPEIILLDDAFQHRKVKGTLNILLTSYNDLFSEDFIFPMGNLRESRCGAKRADIIVITKCPCDISLEEKIEIKKNIYQYNKKANIYFSAIEYDGFVYSISGKIEVEKVKKQNKLLLAGIAKPIYFFDYLKNASDDCLVFSDHHHFSKKDILKIINKANIRHIFTTEKDYMRLNQKIPEEQLFYLPIKTKILDNEKSFINEIENLICKN